MSPGSASCQRPLWRSAFVEQLLVPRFWHDFAAGPHVAEAKGEKDKESSEQRHEVKSKAALMLQAEVA